MCVDASRAGPKDKGQVYSYIKHKACRLLPRRSELPTSLPACVWLCLRLYFSCYFYLSPKHHLPSPKHTACAVVHSLYGSSNSCSTPMKRRKAFISKTHHGTLVINIACMIFMYTYRHTYSRVHSHTLKRAANKKRKHTQSHSFGAQFTHGVLAPQPGDHIYVVT